MPIVATPLQCAQCGVILSSAFTPKTGRVYVHQTNANCPVTGKKYILNKGEVQDHNA
jgi:hypothetical protein